MSAPRARPRQAAAGKHVMPRQAAPRSRREAALTDGLDIDKLEFLAECLFTLNRRRFGPVPGAYVVVCTEPQRRWCVAQLAADRERPLVLFDELEFDAPKKARRAALRLRRTRGERAPARSI